jgi:hypothetical protein
MKSYQIQKNEKFMISSVLNTSFVAEHLRLRRRIAVVVLIHRLAGRIPSQASLAWVEGAHILSPGPTSKTSASEIQKIYLPVSEWKGGLTILILDSALGVRLAVVLVEAALVAVVIAMGSRNRGLGLQEGQK